MASILVEKAFICGNAPFLPSKSLLQRGLITESLFGCGRLSEYKKFLCGEDVKACYNACQKLTDDYAEIFCGDNATLFRMLMPVRIALESSTVYVISRVLYERTKTEIDFLRSLGIDCEVSSGENSTLRVKVCGKLSSSRITVDCTKTSQLFSGFLIASALCGTEIIPVGDSSVGYAKMTAECLKKLGFICEKREGFVLHREFVRMPEIHEFIENDWTHQTNWIVAGLLCGKTFAPDLPQNFLQSDARVSELLQKAGGKVSVKDGGVLAEKSTFDGFVCDASRNPDIVPILSVTACFAESPSVFLHVSRLRSKESDRLTATIALIKCAGAEYECYGETLRVFPQKTPSSGLTEIRTGNDHRISMASAVLGAKRGGLIVRDYDCTGKSSADFYENYKLLGGKYSVVDLG